MENLIDTLHWADIDFDEGPGKDGAFGPYVQSQRLEMYREHAERLVAEGNAYYCFCTHERLEKIRRQSRYSGTLKQSPAYDRHCRSLSTDEAMRKKSAGEPYVIRMKVPESGETSFDDVIRERVTIANSILDDQVLIKSDGFPTYHLAVVVDDHLMRISHVIRGEEWLSSTPKHVLLYRSFGWELPVFAHLSLLLNPDKSKLSKRQGDVAVEEYRAKGYLNEALVNFVALLGWNPGDDREIFTMEELVREFSLERVGKSGAVFNVEKLNWLNFQHLRRKPDAEVLQLLNKELTRAGIDPSHFSEQYLLGVISAMRERVTFVRDVLEKSPYFFRPVDHYDPDVVKKRWKPHTPNHVRVLAEEFSKLQSPRKEDYEAALVRVADALSIKPPELIHPLRLAVSGMGAGPGLYDILALLGRDEVLRRIQTAIERLTQS